jgi:hypothetical protein
MLQKSSIDGKPVSERDIKAVERELDLRFRGDFVCGNYQTLDERVTKQNKKQ